MGSNKILHQYSLNLQKAAKMNGCSQDGKHDHECCTTTCKYNVSQTLFEMEFERGIWYAAQYNDLDRVETLLKKNISPNVEDSAGYTALHYAARNGHYAICEILLQNHADVNARTRCGQATALHRATAQKHIKIVELLLNHGANTNLIDADGYTALHRAVIVTCEPICKLLIPRTDLKSMGNGGQDIKHLVQRNCSDMLPFLLKHMQR